LHWHDEENVIIRSNIFRMDAEDDDSGEEINLDDEDIDQHKFLVVDKDSGKVYDLRKKQDKKEVLNTKYTTLNTNKKKDSAWSHWWKEKKQINLEFLGAAENGEIEEMIKLLDAEANGGDLMAEINVKGLDEWTALHFAASEGHPQAVEKLLQLGAIIDS
jgi:hypothetical protein